MTDDPGKSPPSNPPESDSPEPAAVASESEKEELQEEEDFTPDLTPPESPPAPPSTLETSDGEPPDDTEAGILGSTMTFLEHLDELRKRILHSAAAVAIAFCICWTFSEQIFRFLAVPIADVVGGMDQLIFIRPTEPFSIWVKVSLVAAIFLATPYLVLQVWFFIAPGTVSKGKVLRHSLSSFPPPSSSCWAGLLLTTLFSPQLWSFSSISLALPFVPW